MRGATQIKYRFYVLCCFTLMFRAVWANDSNVKYTPFESEVAERFGDLKQQDPLQILEEIKNAHSPLSAAEYSYWEYLHCFHSPAEKKANYQHLLLPPTKRNSADGKIASYLCQHVKSSNENDAEYQRFKSIYLAYQLQEDAKSAALRYITGYFYTDIALKEGLLSEGISATNMMLDIAIATQSGTRLSYTYSFRALLQAEMKLFDEALKSNQVGLDYVPSTEEWFILTLDRGYILTYAERYDEALKVYQQVLEHPESKGSAYHELTVGSNLSYIYSNTGEKEKNLELTARLLELAEEKGSELELMHTRLSRAYALLDSGSYDEAKKLFEEADSWFVRNNYDVRTAEGYESWAKLLYEQKYYQQAYEYLNKSVELFRDIEERGENKALQMVELILETEQNQRELLQARKSLELADEKRRAQIIQYTTVFIGLVIVIFIVLYFYRKLVAVNAYLNYESNHDALTGAYNRRYFYNFIGKQQSARDVQSLFLLALLDIDHFKSLNDNYGHEVGDKVLQVVVKRLQNAIKECDRLVRWGGEEFLLFMHASDSPKQVHTAIHRVIHEINSNPIGIDGTDFPVTISMGFKVVDKIGNIDTEVKQIDEFLYEAKRNGRKRAIGLLSAIHHNVVPETILAN